MKVRLGRSVRPHSSTTFAMQKIGVQSPRTLKINNKLTVCKKKDKKYCDWEMGIFIDYFIFNIQVRLDD